MSYKNWKVPLSNTDSELYMESTHVDRKSAIVISLNCRISKDNYDLWPANEDGSGHLINRPDSMKDKKNESD